MEEASKSSSSPPSNESEISEIVEEEVRPERKEKVEEVAAAPAVVESSGTGGGWGGWGFSAFSVLSDLQKAATVAAEEISRNAAVVAQTAAKGLAEIQHMGEESETSSKDGDEPVESESEEKTEDDESDKLRKLALDKLEKASEDSILGQSLKVLDHSVENFASGAWQALGSALKGGSNFVHKLEQNLSESIQPGGAGSVAPSLLETGKALTAKGIQVLEHVGKETMDLLITETGIQVDKDSKEGDALVSEEQLFEEVTFDRCFYIYGGPEQLEELEALSSHHALLYNRRKAKLSSEQKTVYDGKLREVQHIFSSDVEYEGGAGKGKKVKDGSDGCSDEMKSLYDSSVSKAADMAAGFTNALTGQSANDMIQRTAGRLESLHSEGVHRLSEMCCLAVSQLLLLGKSVIANANKIDNEDAEEDLIKIDWPEDSVEKAKIIRTKTHSMTSKVEAVSGSFITGISDVVEALQAAIKSATAESDESPPKKSMEERANSFTEHLKSNQISAVEKIMEGLQYLSYVVVSTSVPSA